MHGVTRVRIYLSASTAPSEAQRVQEALAALRVAGFDIVCTWPDIVQKVGDPNPRDASLDERAGWALGDLQEVDESNAVWFLVPSSPATTRGAWLEVGYARAFGKPIVFSGDTKQSVFCALGHECETDVEALAWLIELAQAEDAAMSPVPPLDACHACGVEWSQHASHHEINACPAFEMFRAPVSEGGE